MDRNARVKLGIGAFLAAALAGGAFVGGLRAGASLSAGMQEALLVKVASAHANGGLHGVSLLEQGKAGELEESLNQELDSDLLATCAMLSTGPADGAEERAAWSVVARVARHRRAHPPRYAAAWTGDQSPPMQEARRRLEACLRTVVEKSP